MSLIHDTGQPHCHWSSPYPVFPWTTHALTSLVAYSYYHDSSAWVKDFCNLILSCLFSLICWHSILYTLSLQFPECSVCPSWLTPVLETLLEPTWQACSSLSLPPRHQQSKLLPSPSPTHSPLSLYCFSEGQEIDPFTCLPACLPDWRALRAGKSHCLPASPEGTLCTELRMHVDHSSQKGHSSQ